MIILSMQEIKMTNDLCNCGSIRFQNAIFEQAERAFYRRLKSASEYVIIPCYNKGSVQESCVNSQLAIQVVFNSHAFRPCKVIQELLIQKLRDRVSMKNLTNKGVMS